MDKNIEKTSPNTSKLRQWLDDSDVEIMNCIFRNDEDEFSNQECRDMTLNMYR